MRHSFVYSIKGRLVALVTFFVLVMLLFSWVMFHRNNQLKEEIQQLVEVRMQIQSATTAMELAVGIMLSEVQRDILNQVPLSIDNRVIYHELQVLDSLQSYLGDSSKFLMQTLDQKLAGLVSEHQRANSIWTDYLTQEEKSKVPLYTIHPYRITTRLATPEEQGLLLADTVLEILVEAEEAFCRGALAKYNKADQSGAGYADYINAYEDFVEWRVSVPQSGQYAIFFRYMHGGGNDRPLEVSIDSTVVSTLAFPSAGVGDWGTMMDTPGLVVYLTTGVHTIRATATGHSGPNMNHLRVVGASSASVLNHNSSRKEEGIVNPIAANLFVREHLKNVAKAAIVHEAEAILSDAINEIKQTLQRVQRKSELLLQQDIGRLQQQLGQTNQSNFIAIGVVTLLAILATYVVIRSLSRSIKLPVEHIRQLSAGETDQKAETTRNELNAVIQASNSLSEQLNRASEFAHEIGEGNLQYDFQPISERDRLGNALVQMRNKLLIVAEEDRKRNWQNDGLNQFATLLRQSYENYYQLADQVIAALVRYVKVNQGGLFFCCTPEDGSAHLELIGCYAYERKKYLTKEIGLGEGLLGQTFLENETTYLTEIPNDYLSIRSGLGGANPKSLLIVPVATDQKTEGVIEIASFSEFAEHEIELVEKVAEMIAARLSEMRTRQQTQQLLEATKVQAEQLREQEEELRQNMEEMQATQEQLRRDEQELRDR